MRYASVCSGVEAASLAWAYMRWEPVFFSEIDKFPCAVLAERFPGVTNMGDMTKIKVKENGDIRFGSTGVQFYDGSIDLLVGGTPCQSFSVAGKREGLRGVSGLALDYIRLAYELAAYRGLKWLVWENVPGVFSSAKGGDFAAFLSGLAGWDVATPPEDGETPESSRTQLPETSAWLFALSMPNTSEWNTSFLAQSPSEDAVCSLSDVLETGPVPQRYFLSPKACTGMLNRAEKRGKVLPKILRSILEFQSRGGY